VGWWCWWRVRKVMRKEEVVERGLEKARQLAGEERG
jgi:hypothetical protein